MYRAAIFADLHANLPALQTILKHIHKTGVDEIISLGDNIAIGPHPSRCLDLIMKNRIKSVLGNHEEYYLKGLISERPANMGDDEYEHQLWTHSLLNQDHRNYISSLPYIIERRIDSLSISYMHSPFNRGSGLTEFTNSRTFSPSEIKTAFSQYDNNIICFGHSHVTLDLNLEKIFINPGSVGFHRGSYAKFSLLEIENDLLNVTHKQVFYDRNKVLDDLFTMKVPNKEFISEIFFQNKIKT